MVRPKNNLVWKNYESFEDKSVKCKYCDMIYKQANLKRMTQHLTKCFKCPVEIKCNISGNSSSCQTTNLEKDQNLSQSSILSENSKVSRPRTTHCDVSCEMTTEQKSRLNIKYAKAVFVTRCPLSLHHHPLWQSFFEDLNPFYKIPSRKTLSTTFLESCYNEMKQSITEKVTLSQYLHLQCDGWSNIRHEGIINFVLSTPEPVFVESLPTEQSRHTAEYISSQIIRIMKEFDEKKFIVLIGDNAKNMQKAFQLVKLQYPHVTKLGCAAHILNLLCHDCIKIDIIDKIISKAVKIVNSIKNHQVLSSLLQDIVKSKGSGETLKLPVKTRWSSHFTSLKSLLNTKSALKTLAIDEKAANLPSDIKSDLLQESFWDLLKQISCILEPFADAITKLEGDNAKIDKVFLTFKNLRSQVSFVLSDVTILDNDDKKTIMTFIDNRTKMAIHPIHFAAYLLNPVSHGIELDSDEDIKAMQYIYELGQHFKINIMKELADYKAKDHFWKNRFIWSQVEETDTLSWWKGICSSTQLHKIAIAILSAPCTSAATERTFSAQADIHTNKRNKLTTERAGKITYISHNWNLENKPSSSKITEKGLHMDCFSELFSPNVEAEEMDCVLEPCSPNLEIEEIACDSDEHEQLNTQDIDLTDPLRADQMSPKLINLQKVDDSSESSSN